MIIDDIAPERDAATRYCMLRCMIATDNDTAADTSTVYLCYGIVLSSGTATDTATSEPTNCSFNTDLDTCFCHYNNNNNNCY
jgi:hypothetical protein